MSIQIADLVVENCAKLVHRVPLPPPLKIDVDAVALLLEERGAGGA